MKTCAISLAIALLVSSSVQADLNPELIELRHDWAVAKYQTPQPDQKDALTELAKRAHSITESNPDVAEPLAWEAIVLATLAGESSGFGALSKAKRARKLLEQAEKIDPACMNGSVYTTLGSLYYQVPGWPLGFGDDELAESYLTKALDINPNGIDPNYFYGDYLLSQKKYPEAIAAFERALQAPNRPERPLADAGRRKEVLQAIEKAQELLK